MNSLVTGFIKGIVTKVGGVAGWLLGLLLNFIVNRLIDQARVMKEKYELKKKDEALLKEYLDALSNKDLTREERRDLASRLLNRTP